MSTVLDWLRLARPHTAALTIPYTLLGALVVGNRDPWLLAGIGAWALLAHAWGFGMNALADQLADIRDPEKKDFPLVTGVIDEGVAFVAMTSLGVILLVGSFALAPSGLRWVAFWFGLVHMGFGLLYNWFSKRSSSAPVLISSAFSLLPYWACTVSGIARAPTAVLFVSVYGFFAMLHQISFSGYLKDLAADRVNWLKSMGSVALPMADRPGWYDYHISVRAQWWGLVSRAVPVALATWWVVASRDFGMSRFLGILAVALLAASQYLALSVAVSSCVRPRVGKLRAIAWGEVCSWWMLVVALGPKLAYLPWAWALLVFGPLAWFVAFNLVMYRRWVAPAV